MVLKYCPRHRDLLPISQFGINRSSKDGYMWVCRECENKSAILRYARRKLGIAPRPRTRTPLGTLVPFEDS